MAEKKKSGQVQNANALIFILFWVVSVVFLQFNYWTMWSNIYDFIVYQLHPIFHRLWIAYVFHGFVIGLGFGLAQKAAIQALRPIRLQYWVALSAFLGVAAKVSEYLTIRYIDWQSYDDPALYFIGIAIVYQLVTLLGQWWLLRKHFKQASVWLLLLLPTIATYLFDFTYSFLNPAIIQAIFSALALLWMNHQTVPTEKSKNSAEAEARLVDKLEDDEDDFQNFAGAYQASEA